MTFQFKVGEAFVPSSSQTQINELHQQEYTDSASSSSATPTLPNTDPQQTNNNNHSHNHKPKITMVHLLNIPPGTKWRQVKNDLLVPSGVAEDTILHIQIFEDNGSCIVSLNSEESVDIILDSLEGYNWNGFFLMVRTDEQMKQSYNPVELNLTPLINQAYLNSEMNHNHNHTHNHSHNHNHEQQQQVHQQSDHRSPPVQQIIMQYPPHPPPPQMTSAHRQLPPGTTIRYGPPPQQVQPSGYATAYSAQINPQLNQIPPQHMSQFAPGGPSTVSPTSASFFQQPISLTFEPVSSNQIQQRFLIPSNPSTNSNSPMNMNYRTAPQQPPHPQYIYNLQPPLQRSRSYYQNQSNQVNRPRYQHQRSQSTISIPRQRSNDTSSITSHSTTSPNISSRTLGSLRQYPYQTITEIDSTIPDKTRLFIGNIPYTSEWKNLKDYLRNAGAINRVEIPHDIEGYSKGFAIATYNNEVDAKRAIDLFNGIDFEGRPLTVRYDRFPIKRQLHNASLNLSQQSLDQVSEDNDKSKSINEDSNKEEVKKTDKENDDDEGKKEEEDEDKRFEDEARNLIESMNALNFK